MSKPPGGTLGVNLTDVQELDDNAKRALEPLLASRGFNVREVIHVSRRPRDEGFLLTQ
jgi:hypothetical protein